MNKEYHIRSSIFPRIIAILNVLSITGLLIYSAYNRYSDMHYHYTEILIEIAIWLLLFGGGIGWITAFLLVASINVTIYSDYVVTSSLFGRRTIRYTDIENIRYRSTAYFIRTYDGKKYCIKWPIFANRERSNKSHEFFRKVLENRGKGIE